MTNTEFDKTVAVEASGAEATILGTTVKCPVCQTENAPNEMYCGECGFLLTSTPGEEAPEFEAAAQPKLVDSAGREYFLREGSLRLQSRAAAPERPCQAPDRQHHAQRLA